VLKLVLKYVRPYFILFRNYFVQNIKVYVAITNNVKSFYKLLNARVAQI